MRKTIEIKKFLRVESEFIERRMHHPFSISGFVLRHGQSFKPQPLPPHWREWRGIVKECYRNALHAAIENPDLIYVEGYAAGLLPVLHAWCLTQDGKLLEFTWPKPGAEYWGVPFQTRFATQQLQICGHYGLIDQWQLRWPLLQGKYHKREWHQKLKGTKHGTESQ